MMSARWLRRGGRAAMCVVSVCEVCLW